MRLWGAERVAERMVVGRLHKLIRADLPHCPRGLVEIWKQIAAIQKRQKTDPGYQFVAELPPPVSASS